MRTAAAGLVVVLLCLTMFAASAAVLNARATAAAQTSGHFSDLSERAESALAEQEDAADAVVEEADGEARRAHARANAAARAVLAALRAADRDETRGFYGQLLVQHQRYADALENLFAAASRSPETAEGYETEHVDPHYEALLRSVTEVADRHAAEARSALSSGPDAGPDSG